MCNLNDTIQGLRDHLRELLGEYDLTEEDVEDVLTAQTNEDPVNIARATQELRELTTPGTFRMHETMAQVLREHGYTVTYTLNMPFPKMGLIEGGHIIKIYLMLRAIRTQDRPVC